MLAQPAAEHDRRFLESLLPGSRGDKCGRELMDSHWGLWRVGVISGKLAGAVRSTSPGLGADEVVGQPDVGVLGAVNCRFERDLQNL
jgi:hypothetical protein